MDLDKKLKLSFKKMAGYMNDRDMDTVPDMLDCQPCNPRKRDAGVEYESDIDSGVTTERKIGILHRLGNVYKEYKAKEPERRQKKLERAQYEAQMGSIRNQSTSERLKLQSQRLDIMAKRQKVMGTMPSMFSGGIISHKPERAPSPWVPMPGFTPPKPTQKKKSKRKTRVKYVTRYRYISRRRR